MFFACLSLMNEQSRQKVAIIINIYDFISSYRGVCKTEAQHVRDLINVFTPVMSSAYDNQRVVVTAFFSEVSKTKIFKF